MNTDYKPIKPMKEVPNQLRKLQRIEEINRALLAADKAAEEPDDLVDSLNPMESREKAADVLKSAAEPQEIVDLVMYVASEKGAFINGVNILADGGRDIMRNKG